MFSITKDLLKFEWDTGNINHIEEHSLTPEEIERAYLEDNQKKVFFDKEHSTNQEKRYFSLAKTPDTGDILKLVFIIKKNKKIRIITAYKCSNDKRLVKLYYTNNNEEK